MNDSGQVSVINLFLSGSSHKKKFYMFSFFILAWQIGGLQRVIQLTRVILAALVCTSNYLPGVRQLADLI
jgi:hypothetical protein